MKKDKKKWVTFKSWISDHLSLRTCKYIRRSYDVTQWKQQIAFSFLLWKPQLHYKGWYNWTCMGSVTDLTLKIEIKPLSYNLQ